LSGHGGNVGLLPDAKSWMIIVLSMSERRSTLTPGVLSGPCGVDLILLKLLQVQPRLAYRVRGRCIRAEW
jgi:hypothetical protein